jgi:hypothetical protein
VEVSAEDIFVLAIGSNRVNVGARISKDTGRRNDNILLVLVNSGVSVSTKSLARTGAGRALDGISLLLIRLAANIRVSKPITYSCNRGRKDRSGSSGSFGKGSCGTRNWRIPLSQGTLNGLLGSLASPRAFEASHDV